MVSLALCYLASHARLSWCRMELCEWLCPERAIVAVVTYGCSHPEQATTDATSAKSSATLKEIPGPRVRVARRLVEQWRHPREFRGDSLQRGSGVAVVRLPWMLLKIADQPSPSTPPGVFNDGTPPYPA